MTQTTSMPETLVSWLVMLLTFAGAVVAAGYLRRSRWTAFVFGGFLAQAVIRLASEFALPRLITNSPSALPRVRLFFLITSVVGLFAYAALVVGVAGILSELSRLSAGAKEHASQ
jgi:hypothetical protein